MHRLLIVTAFAKAELKHTTRTGKSPSKTQQAQELSDYLMSQDFTYSERRLRDYYNAAVEGEHFAISTSPVVDLLSRYLDYATYQDFCRDMSTPQKSELPGAVQDKDKFAGPLRQWVAWYGIVPIAAVVLILFVMFNTSAKKDSTSWMAWTGSHYEEVPFDTTAMQQGRLLLYDQQRIEQFKKIAVSCDSTIFFGPSGTPLVWYYKPDQQHVEFYSAPGVVPYTKKYTKPITPYMIEKWVCN